MIGFSGVLRVVGGQGFTGQVPGRGSSARRWKAMASSCPHGQDAEIRKRGRRLRRRPRDPDRRRKLHSSRWVTSAWRWFLCPQGQTAADEGIQAAGDIRRRGRTGTRDIRSVPTRIRSVAEVAARQECLLDRPFEGRELGVRVTATDPGALEQRHHIRKTRTTTAVSSTHGQARSAAEAAGRPGTDGRPAVPSR